MKVIPTGIEPGNPEIVVLCNITEDGQPMRIRRAGDVLHRTTMGGTVPAQRPR